MDANETCTYAGPARPAAPWREAARTGSWPVLTVRREGVDARVLAFTRRRAACGAPATCELEDPFCQQHAARVRREVASFAALCYHRHDRRRRARQRARVAAIRAVWGRR